MSLGWTQVEYKERGIPWYKPAEQVVKCKYCDGRFKAGPKHLPLAAISLAVAIYIFGEQGFSGWGKWVIGLLLGLVVYLFILEANRQYERID